MIFDIVHNNRTRQMAFKEFFKNYIMYRKCNKSWVYRTFKAIEIQVNQKESALHWLGYDVGGIRHLRFDQSEKKKYFVRKDVQTQNAVIKKHYDCIWCSSLKHTHLAHKLYVHTLISICYDE